VFEHLNHTKQSSSFATKRALNLIGRGTTLASLCTGKFYRSP